MSASAIRAALVVFLLGVLVVWLIRPIGDACPDIGKLPAGSRSSSAPSLTPPLTRTCTYTTVEGTAASQRYVPVVDWLVLAVFAGVVGLGVGLFRGPATARGPRRDEGEPELEPWLDRPPERARKPAAPAPAPEPPRRAKRTAREPPAEVDSDARAAERERERQERARRRSRG